MASLFRRDGAKNVAVPSSTPSPSPAPAAAARNTPSPAPAKTSASSSSTGIPVNGEYITVAIPEKHLAFSNKVYMAPSAFQALKKEVEKMYLAQKSPGKILPQEYVQINNLVFLAEPHSSINPNEIALGSRHRESLNLPSNQPEGATVLVRPFILPADGSMNLSSIVFELVSLEKRKITMKDSEVIQHIRSTFGIPPQVFTKNQVLVADIDGIKCNLTVKRLEAFKPVHKDDEHEDEAKDNSSISQFIDQGVLLKATSIAIEAEETKLFKLEISANRAKMFNPDWKFADMGIGGLDTEFSAIFRRAFASRLFPPEIIEQLGIKHVKGMLLYGPPGTGKTLIARQIGKMLAGKEPQVVNGPEILNKFVGQSEENIRKLFLPAEEDYAKNKENADLHIIIFDEIDAICKARGTSGGSTGVHDTVVNQLLSKIDGVNSPNNILVIGMTNRKDMLDPALIRPGRLEVHVEISLPDFAGRIQIFNIHTRKMRESGKLAADVDIEKLAELTKNFSGSEIEGLVKAATSFALNGCIDTNKGGKGGIGLRDEDLENILVTMDDFIAALEEVKPAFGVAEDELKALVRGDLYDYGVEFEKLMSVCQTLVRQVQNSNATPLLSILLEGAPGSGKTAIAAKIGLDSKFPFVKLISPEQYIGLTESAKSNEIARVFDDAYKSPLSLIILDGIERLLDYVPIGPRFSNQVLQTLSVLIPRVPPKQGNRLLIIGTTSDSTILEDMQLRSAFNVIQTVPQITKPMQVKKVFELAKVPCEPAELDKLARESPFPVPMKSLLMVIEMAKQDTPSVTADVFRECVQNTGLGR